MEITSFESSAGLVTLHMRDMPNTAQSHNTDVYIAGESQVGVGARPAISLTKQEIVFKPKNDAKKGKISVMIGDLTAESAEDYTPPTEGLPDNQRPVVQSISQQTAAAGERRFIRGQNLGDVTNVSLYNGSGYYACTGITANNDSVQFTVPLNAPASQALLPVYIKTRKIPVLTRTPVSLRIVEH